MNLFHETIYLLCNICMYLLSIGVPLLGVNEIAEYMYYREWWGSRHANFCLDKSCVVISVLILILGVIGLINHQNQ